MKKKYKEGTGIDWNTWEMQGQWGSVTDPPKLVRKPTMIVAKATGRKGKKETTICILGLTTANLNAMLAGKPVHVRAEAHPGALPEGYEIMIFHGQSEEAIRQMFEQHGLIGQNTKLIIDPRLERG